MSIASFEKFFQEYQHLVFNLALQYVPNKQDAEEITQDVFISIHQSFADFEHRAKISTWIYRITINKSLDFIKAQKRKKRRAWLVSLFDLRQTPLEPLIFDHPGVQLEQKEAIQHIFKCLNELPDRQKTALILSKIEQKSQQEIAEIMQLSPKAVESLVQRAKNNFGKKWSEAKDHF